MSHVGQEAIRRILSGTGGPLEVEPVAEHLVSCDRCRALAGTVADELGSEGLPAEGPLQLVLELIDRERQWAVDYLAAVAEWSELRRLANRRSQRDRVRMTKACHTIAFFQLVLGELKETSSWDEAEFLAGLALLSIDAMRQRQRITQAAEHDLKGRVWTAVANARRRAAEWERAHQALANAERYLKEGTGDPLLEAELLSISASTLANQGHLSRALVKTASLVVDSEPAQALEALDEAAPLLPPDDSHLVLLADLLRVECLLGVSRPSEALQVFRRCSRLLNLNPRMQIRGRFTGAKLLDALGYKQPAERLYEEVVDREIEQELYKEAFLDLLYLYGRHVKAGEIEKAARVCRRALTDPSLSAVAHDQMREVWKRLLDATGRHAVGQEVLNGLRRYLSAHWKRPAAMPPAVS